MGARGVARVVTVALACALVVAAGAGATDFGANDDTGKFEPDAGASFYREMASIGMRQTVITVRWLPTDPLGLGDRPLLDLTVAAARSAGLSVVFAAYPYPPREVAEGLARPEAFGAWLAELARQYPNVRQFVVGNEPNQPAFWRPQFAGASQLSARTFGPFLAAGYDALKEVDPTLLVVGVGLSPRGNDRPSARSNVSTSPMRFLQALGAWYRSSGRERPLMDGLSFHPYPNRATDPLSRGYAWPNAGFVNLDRVKQAIWDAFAGTAQPTTLDGLPLYLDEVGWQVDTTGRNGYEGDENVAVTNEETQADVYGALVRAAACDPDVAAVNLFGFRDDALRTGFQAGLFRADGSERPALGAVRGAIASPTCAEGAAARWHPSRAVIGATRPNVRLAASSVVVDVRAAEGASARVCLLRGAHTLSSARRALTSRPLPVGICVSGAVEANRLAIFRLVRRAGRQTLAVRLAADANAARSSTVVRPLPRCLTSNTCSGTMRTDVRSPRTRPDHAPRGGGAAALGAFRG
jgi:hypothetical protein